MKSRSKQLHPKWVGRIFTFVGAIFFVVGGVMLWNVYDFMKTAEQTTGVVLHVDRIVTRDSDGTSITYSPTFRYEDGNGVTHESSPTLRSSSYNFPTGSEVDILFDPAKPAKIRIDGFFSTWGFAGVFAAFGALFIVIGGVASWKLSESGATPPDEDAEEEQITTPHRSGKDWSREPTVRRQ